MNESMITAVGIVAGIGTTTAWMPQVWKTVTTRSAKDFSWPYLALFSTGVSLWAVYGVLKKDFVIITVNVVTLALVIVVALVKMRER